MRSMFFATALALTTLVAVPALAAPHEGAETGEHSEHAKRFPMPAAEFKAKVDHRMEKARARMEAKAAKLDATEAKELRAKFEGTEKNVSAELAKAVADGTVTKEEAKAVRALAPHRGRHARHGK
jgi:hypothetical protein